jgi:protein SCO1/2
MNKYKNIFKKNLLLMLILILTIFIGLFFINFFNSSQKSYDRNIGQSFSLVDHNNQNFNSYEVKKKKLIYFGYTYCPDVCPFDMVKISQIFTTYPELEKKIKPLFITVDPNRDTTKQLKIFIESFHSSFLGLTGTKEMIEKVIRAFRIYVKLNKKSDTDDDYLVDHSSLIFLLDENDKLVTFFRPDDLNGKLQKYLKKAI